MRRLLVAASIVALAVLASSFTPSAPRASVRNLSVVSAGGTCEDKHCPKNTHCCFGCTANPICVRNGVPCPECAPQ